MDSTVSREKIRARRHNSHVACMASGESPPFQSHLRSQSSVQLLGFIENCIRVDVPETTDEGELRIKGYETLIKTSTSVLSCIQVGELCACWLEIHLI